MKKLLILVFSLSLAMPVAGIAAPGWGGGPHGGPHGGYGWGGGPHRGARFDFLPGAAATVLIAGLTYYVLDGIYYQRDHNQYVVVDAPPAPAPVYVNGGMSGNMTVLDLNGERYYVNQGHYYRRNIDGQYLEVPRPPGL